MDILMSSMGPSVQSSMGFGLGIVEKSLARNGVRIQMIYPQFIHVYGYFNPSVGSYGYFHLGCLELGLRLW